MGRRVNAIEDDDSAEPMDSTVEVADPLHERGLEVRDAALDFPEKDRRGAIAS